MAKILRQHDSIAMIDVSEDAFTPLLDTPPANPPLQSLHFSIPQSPIASKLKDTYAQATTVFEEDEIVVDSFKENNFTVTRTTSLSKDSVTAPMQEDGRDDFGEEDLYASTPRKTSRQESLRRSRSNDDGTKGSRGELSKADVASIFNGSQFDAGVNSAVPDAEMDAMNEKQNGMTTSAIEKVSATKPKAPERAEENIGIPAIPTQQVIELQSTKDEQRTKEAGRSANTDKDERDPADGDSTALMIKAQKALALEQPITQASKPKDRKSLPATISSKPSSKDTKAAGKAKETTKRKSLPMAGSKTSKDIPDENDKFAETRTSKAQSALGKLRSRRSREAVASQPPEPPTTKETQHADVYSFPEELLSDRRVYGKSAKKATATKTKGTIATKSLRQSRRIKKLELVPDYIIDHTPEPEAEPTTKKSSKEASARSKDQESKAEKREPPASEGISIQEDEIVVAHPNGSVADENSPKENRHDLAEHIADDANRGNNSDEQPEIDRAPAEIDPQEQGAIKGSSHYHALVVSDGEESSEDETLVPVDQLGSKQTVPLKVSHVKETTLPKTPAIKAKDLSTPMNSSHRVNIIAFDQSGPRNQGSTLSTAKKCPTVYTKHAPKRAPLSKKDPNQKMHVDKELTKASSSFVKETRDRQKPAKSKLGNVANTMNDALAGLLPSKRQSMVEDTSAAKSSKRQKVNHESDLIAQTNGVTKPIPHDHEESLADDLLYNFDDFVRTSTPVQHASPAKPKIAMRTASQLAMPPPKKVMLDLVQSKFVLDKESDIRAHRSSSRLTDHRSDQSVRSRKGDESALSKSKAKVIDREKTNETFTILDDQEESSGRKRVRLQETPPKAQMTTTTSKHSSDGSFTRRKSSQTVDIRGSPVPRDMEIDDQATVLEAYCHQTQQSPDSEDAIGDDSLPPPPPPFTAETPLADLSMLLPRRSNDPLLDSGSILSSRKPRPAAPLANSDVVTGLQTRKVDNALLLGRETAETVPSNPSIQKSISKDAKPSETRSFPPPPDPAHKLDEQLDLIRHRLGQSRLITSASHPHFSQDHISNTLSTSRETTIRALTAGHALLPTPTNPKPTLSPTKTTQQNLALWRSALRPHHLNLFDELVSLAHRATQDLVDQDTAFNQSLADYQRRSLTIIEKWEEHQKAFYQQLKNSLGRKRGLVRRELRAYVKNIEGCAGVASKVRGEWEGLSAERRRVDERVEGVLRRFGGGEGE